MHLTVTGRCDISRSPRVYFLCPDRILSPTVTFTLSNFIEEAEIPVGISGTLSASFALGDLVSTFQEALEEDVANSRI